MYVRKTYDEYEIHTNYGDGFECETTEPTYKDAKRSAREYRENAQCDVKIVKKRVKK